ncbi:MFS transporter [Planococcus lenghuensis]|uniref:MFS transporter n=1 Tax=Planococcus lenghuensis TaxID=2213202 RepID=A0A1Q2L1P5_9BACL|nr:MFS transporter [Planococcus lenghuensis]AQQ54380.1 MFS transporter [Planococcus lenghuensis]
MAIQHIYYGVTGTRSLLIQMVFTLNAIYYVSVAELNPLQLVLIGTIMELSVLLFELPTGLTADRFGRKLSLVIGTGVLGFAHILEGSIPEFWAIAAASASWGLGWTFISGAEQAWIADELEGRQLEQVFLRGAQYSSFGRFLGIVLSVGLATLFTVQATIIIAGALLTALAAGAFFIVPETKFIRTKREGSSGLADIAEALSGGFGQIRGSRTLTALAIVTLMWGLASEGYDRLWGALFIEDFNLLNEEAIYWFGFFYALAFLLNIIVLQIVERYVKGRYASVLLIANTLLVASMLGFAWAGAFYAAVLLYFVTGALRNINYPLMNIMTNERLASKGRATALSMFGQLDAFGQIAGGPIVGLIALYTSISGGITASALLLVPGIWFIWKLKKTA